MEGKLVQWTDEYITITVEDEDGGAVDLTGATGIRVTLAQNGAAVIDKTDEVELLSADTVGCHLTPEETGKLLCSAPAVLYVNWTGADGRSRGKGETVIGVEDNYPRRPI